MALTDAQIEAALDRVYALIGDADAAWDHHPELTLGELVNVIVKGLTRKDLEVLAGHCLVEHLITDEDLEDDEPPVLLN